jgi:hypothetical protein
MKIRRSDRVSLSVPILVSWTTSPGRNFTKPAQTLVVSRHGATIVVRENLAQVQQITIRCSGTDREASAQVVGRLGQRQDGYLYGLAVQDPTVNLWNIEFPTLAGTEEAVSRVLLECSACKNREVVHLDELQTEVFEASHGLSRACEQCAVWTLWKPVSHGASSDRNANDPWHERGAQSSRAPMPRTRNERKHVRARMKLTACVRQIGFGEEVVQIENASRGGFCFVSSRKYPNGTDIQVAVPYEPSAANIFVLARIIRHRDLPQTTNKEYGVTYN